jgi:hypothetical protein
MNGTHTAFQTISHATKFLLILVLGISTGIMAALYTPLFPLVGSAVFATLAIGMYVSSQYRMARANIIAPSLPDTRGNGVLFSMFYLGFFLSITIPKSGRTLASVPITTANIVILFTLVCWFLSVLVFQKSFSHIPASNALITFIAYGVLSAIIGFVNNNHKKAIALEFVAFFGFIPLYFLVCHVLRTKRQIKFIIVAVMLSLCMVCGYALLQIKFGSSTVAVPGITEQYGMILYEQFGGRWNLIEGGRQKLYSTFQNGNIFGHHLAMFLPFFGGVIISFKGFWKKVFLSGVLIVALYTLFLTYSRGAVVGAISGFLILGLITKKIRLRVLLIILMLFVAAFIFLSQYSDRPEFNRYNIRRIKEDPNQFSAGRLERASQALAGFQRLSLHQKLIGIGLGGVLVYVDNLYLTLLLKMGIIGVVLLGWVLGCIVVILLRLRTRSPSLQVKGLINGGVAGLVAALIHCLADVLWLFPPLSANFWFLAGISISIGMINMQEHNTETKTLGEDKDLYLSRSNA